MATAMVLFTALALVEVTVKVDGCVPTHTQVLVTPHPLRLSTYTQTQHTFTPTPFCSTMITVDGYGHHLSNCSSFPLSINCQHPTQTRTSNCSQFS